MPNRADDIRHAGEVCKKCGGNVLLDNILEEYYCLQCGHRPRNYVDWPYKAETSPSYRAASAGRKLRKRDATGGYIQQGEEGGHYKVAEVKSWECIVTWGKQPRPASLHCQWLDCYSKRSDGPRKAISGIYCDTHSEAYRQAWNVEPPTWNQFAIYEFVGKVRIDYTIESTRRGAARQYTVCALPDFVDAPHDMPPTVLREKWKGIQQRFKSEIGVQLHMPAAQLFESDAA